MERFSSIACNSTIVSNKQRQEHNKANRNSERKRNTLVENMVKKNRSRFPITVLLTTFFHVIFLAY